MTNSATRPRRASLLARYGPLTAVIVAIAMVAALASTGRNEQPTSRAKSKAASATNPLLPITWAEAAKAKATAKYQWGRTCDPATGRIRQPSVYAPPCVVGRPGVTGGATSQGVTADTIKVVAYEAADDDISATLQAKNDDPADVRATRLKLLDMLAKQFNTWGRKLEVVNFKGTGSDETASRADAVKVATEFKAFASLGGPGQQGSYAAELANRGVICIGCGLSVPDSIFQTNAPYMWGSSQTPEQYLPMLGDLLIDRLDNRPAQFAGDPAMRTRKRVFGSIHFEQDPPVFTETSKEVDRVAAQRGFETKVRNTYQLVIPELAEKARVIIARMKEAKVTTVIFLGDPIMPIYLTKAATAQGYFPEWIITGTVLTDTTTLGRMYDQKQWAHAFGISSLPVRQPPKDGEARRLYQWFYGEQPAAAKTVGLLYDSLRIFMTGVHMAGPRLTPETFRDGLFAYPPSGGSAVSPQVSFGNHGFFAAPDYLGIDDWTEIWWDAEAKGPDEQGTNGTGLMRYSNGGRRYLPGKLPRTPVTAFDNAGSVLAYDQVPPAMAPPTYPSPTGGG